METYEAMMDNQMPHQNSVDYTGSFAQFSNNGNMSGNYNSMSSINPSFSTPQTHGGGSMSVGAFSTPSSQSGFGNMSSSVGQSSFTMPYDPPAIAGSQAVQMSTPPTVSRVSNKVIHSCSFCGLVLSSANALIEHKRIHTGDRPFACNVCNKRFTQKAHLNIHKRTHTGEKPYACHICHKRFAQSSHLTSHKRIHSDEKPYVCGICQAGFTQKQRLDMHLKKHLDQQGQDHGPLMNQSGPSDQFRTSNEENGFMQMVGHGMPYVKQEPDIHMRDSNAMTISRVQGAVNQDCFNKNVDDDLQSKSRTEMPALCKSDEQEVKEEKTSENISASSFSSEGMFLHPSGYVAYGGVEDGEQQQNQHVESGESSSNETNQPLSFTASSGGHRRKPTVVRKRYSESLKEENDSSPVQTLGEAIMSNSGVSGFQTGSDSIKVEEEGGAVDDFHDTGEMLDDKNDPPYLNCNGNGRDHSTAVSLTSTNQSMSQSSINLMETRSHSRRAVYKNQPHTFQETNGTTVGRSSCNLTYSVPSNALANSGLAKVNNRISLVNFTAEELISHLMKRDDVHKCEFCCLIFQDAAMYHIHRNMHDKGDIRMCNMCGKVLQDKYDFTAHFLSMHKS